MPCCPCVARYWRWRFRGWTASYTRDGRPSAFGGVGLAKTVRALGDEIRELYLGDAVPWVVGYSGGKDSSAVLQLMWNAIRELPAPQRT